MAIKLRSAKTTAAGASGILVTLGGIATAFSEIPADELTDTQLIAFGAVALATLFNSIGNIFSRDNDVTSEEALGTRVVAEKARAEERAGR